MRRWVIGVVSSYVRLWNRSKEPYASIYRRTEERASGSLRGYTSLLQPRGRKKSRPCGHRSLLDELVPKQPERGVLLEDLVASIIEVIPLQEENGLRLLVSEGNDVLCISGHGVDSHQSYRRSLAVSNDRIELVVGRVLFQFSLVIQDLWGGGGK